MNGRIVDEKRAISPNWDREGLLTQDNTDMAPIGSNTRCALGGCCKAFTFRSRRSDGERAGKRPLAQSLHTVHTAHTALSTAQSHVKYGYMLCGTSSVREKRCHFRWFRRFEMFLLKSRKNWNFREKFVHVILFTYSSYTGL